MDITYCYTQKMTIIMYCYMQKLSAATLVVLRGSKSRLSAARVACCLEFGCYAAVRRFSIGFFEFVDFPVDVDVIAELFQKFVDYAHTLHAFKI